MVKIQVEVDLETDLWLQRKKAEFKLTTKEKTIRKLLEIVQLGEDEKRGNM